MNTTVTSAGAIVLAPAVLIESSWGRVRESGGDIAFDVRSNDVARLPVSEVERVLHGLSGQPTVTLPDGTVRVTLKSAPQVDAVDRAFNAWATANGMGPVADLHRAPAAALRLQVDDAVRSGSAAQVHGGWLALPAGTWQVATVDGTDGRTVSVTLTRVS